MPPEDRHSEVVVGYLIVVRTCNGEYVKGMFKVKSLERRKEYFSILSSRSNRALK